MNTETNTKPQTVGQYRPHLCFYHANAKGSGGAAKMSLHPAHDDVNGCIMLTVANQMSIGNPTGPNPTFATFDWENALTVKLDFDDLCLFLQVLRGECESINEGKGLYHRAPCGVTNIRFCHYVDPSSGYMLDIYRSSRRGGAEDAHARILLSSAEATGICESIAGSLYLVSFGIPMLIPHDTSAYRAEAKGVRRAVAA